MLELDKFSFLLGVSFEGLEVETKDLFRLIEKKRLKGEGGFGSRLVESKRLQSELKKFRGVNYERKSECLIKKWSIDFILFFRNVRGIGNRDKQVAMG